MSFITSFLHQTLVYWQFSGSDAYGKQTYLNPVELSCRWNDTLTELIDAKGDRFMSSAFVYVEVPLVNKSVIFLGTLSDLPSVVPTDPKTLQGTWEIKQTKMTPSVTNKDRVYQGFV